MSATEFIMITSAVALGIFFAVVFVEYMKGPR
jgi:hypothetical protein